MYQEIIRGSIARAIYRAIYRLVFMYLIAERVAYIQ